MGLFDKLKRGLRKTKDLLRTDVRDLFKAGEILDDEKLEEFEGRLLRTDMGVAATTALIDELRTKHGGRTIVVDEVWQTVKDKLKQLLRGDGDIRWDVNDPLSPVTLADSGPTVFLVAGVNGGGKTTSIAKMTLLLQAQGKAVVLAAGDTLREAALEQLTKWSERG